MLFGGCLGSGHALLCPLGSVCLFCLICILFVGLWGCSGDGCVGLSGLFYAFCVSFWHVHGLWVVGCISVSSVFLFCIFYAARSIFLNSSMFTRYFCYTFYRLHGGGHLYLQAVPSLPWFNHGKIMPGGGHGSRSPPALSFWVNTSVGCGMWYCISSPLALSSC